MTEITGGADTSRWKRLLLPEQPLRHDTSMRDILASYRGPGRERVAGFVEHRIAPHAGAEQAFPASTSQVPERAPLAGLMGEHVRDEELAIARERAGRAPGTDAGHRGSNLLRTPHSLLHTANEVNRPAAASADELATRAAQAGEPLWVTPSFSTLRGAETTIEEAAEGILDAGRLQIRSVDDAVLDGLRTLGLHLRRAL